MRQSAQIALIGLAVMGLVRSPEAVPGNTATILLVGRSGGFTTSSSYAVQSVELPEGGRPVAAARSMLATNLLVLAFAWAGLGTMDGA